ncbi:MAG: HAD family hydrolase [Verrucomicrobiae bacterium]|nr:HAD family hydrolase [Verrucomicrobiae bacterium]
MSGFLEIMAAQSSQLDPVPTGLAPRLKKLDGIKAVVFDIYGTLFISGSGDISLAGVQDLDSVMLEVLVASGITWTQGATGISQQFLEEIKASHAGSRALGIDFPEVEIREIWKGLLQCQGDGMPSDGAIEALAVRYETTVNPVWPMPGLEALLVELRARRMKLGIISNAQFYTPLLFRHFLGRQLSSLGFDDELCVWSYREGIGKPSQRLFDISVARLASYGLSPCEVLYVGNDMRNDMVPAAAAGMRTALFAGDARSLRLREHSVDALLVDVVLTRLDQLLQCIDDSTSAS